MGHASCQPLDGVRLRESIGDERHHHCNACVTAGEAGAGTTAFTGAGLRLVGRGGSVRVSMPVVPGMWIRVSGFGRGVRVSARRAGLCHHLLSEQTKAKQPHERSRVSLHDDSVARHDRLRKCDDASGAPAGWRYTMNRSQLP